MKNTICSKKYLLAFGFALVGMYQSAQAQTILEIDLTVTNQLTIRSLDENAGFTQGGIESLILETFFDAFSNNVGGWSGTSASASTLIDVVSGKTAELGVLSGSISGIYGGNIGIHSFSSANTPNAEVAFFNTTTRAFVGESTFVLTPTAYSHFTNPSVTNTFGNVRIMNALTEHGDLIGTWALVAAPVPETSSIALLGVGGLALILRRRK